jgi:hypothetical protein
VDVTPAPAKDKTEALAKLAQNPVGNLISVPFQWNMGFGAGPHSSYQSTLNIQPVIPIAVNENWNIITRTILPVESWPAPSSDTHVTGIGDTTFTAFLSPGKPGKFIWGVGPAFLFPTASSPELGSGKWGLGPSLVGLYMGKHIVAGALVNNIWSYAGWGGKDVNVMTLQPFFNYNFPWLVSHDIADHHCGLARFIARRVDGAPRRRLRQNHPRGQAAHQPLRAGLLQRRHASLRRRLVHSSPMPAAFSEMKIRTRPSAYPSATAVGGAPWVRTP